MRTIIDQSEHRIMTHDRNRNDLQTTTVMEGKQPNRLRCMAVWIFLTCFQAKVTALLPFDKTILFPNDVCNSIKVIILTPYAPRPVPLRIYSTPMDDDDISQHETMTSGVEGQESESTSKATKKKTGYRRIEEWHEETVSKNPKQILTRLQQEKSMWDKKFEDLGGDGI